MEEPEVKDLNPESLRDLMSARNEREYLLIDVRQPAEYRAGHIPGAFFLPLMELETRLFELPEDRELIFYCHSGGRSLAAASLAAEAEVTEKGVYNLAGGILAWDGKMLADYPKVQVFAKDAGFEQMLHTAMDLEKGAWRFYRAAVKKAAGTALEATLVKLAEAETAHARAVYKHWAPTQDAPQPFEPLFEGLSGGILEGGASLEDIVGRMEELDGDACMNLIELALHIEYSAYDLYRTVAERTAETREKSAFLSIAQAEKGHMRMLTRAVPGCES